MRVFETAVAVAIAAAAVVSIAMLLPAAAVAADKYTVVFYTDPADMARAVKRVTTSPDAPLAQLLADTDRAGAPLMRPVGKAGHYVDSRGSDGHCAYQVFDSRQPSYRMGDTQANPRVSSALTVSQANAVCAETDVQEDRTIFAYRYYAVERHVDSGKGSCAACGFALPIAKAWAGKAQIKGARYKLNADHTAVFLGLTGKKLKRLKKLSVSATVESHKTTYRVTGIAAKALAGAPKLAQATIGQNVTQIGGKVFFKCRNLKTVLVKSKALKSIGTKAFSKCSKLVRFECKTKPLDRRMLKRAGLL